MSKPTSDTDQAIKQLTEQIAQLSINLAAKQQGPQTSVNYADTPQQARTIKQPPLVIIVDVLDISSPIAIPERKMKANVQVALVTTIEIIGVLVLVLVVETILIEIEADPEIETIIAEVITIGIAHPILAIAPIAHLSLIIETYTIGTKTIPLIRPLLVLLNGKP